MNWSVWGAPIAVLCAGVIVGLVIAIRSTGTSRRDPQAEAMAKKESLVEQLRTLRTDRAKLSQAQFEANWNRLLDAAATALRDAETPPLPEPTPTPIDAKSQSSWGKRLAWVMVSVAFFVGLGALLKMSTDKRVEGGSMTGGSQTNPVTMTKTIDRLEQQVQDEPQNIEPLNQLAYIAIQKGDLAGAMKWMDRARAIDPNHVEVRTHMGILQASVGMTDRANGELTAALELEPTFSKALFWKGLIALRTGDRTGAISLLEDALNNAPNREARIMATQALAEARKPPAKIQLKGSIKFAEGTTPSTKGILFIMVRRSEQGAGPPIAALRLDPKGLPGTFSVTNKDMMMGGDWPEQVWIEARLDTDGNPSTKESTDLFTKRLGPFTAGSEGIELYLSAESVGAQQNQPKPRISGHIELAPGVKKPSTGAVFVIFRRTATPSGPPLAAIRLPLSGLPGPYSAGDQDIMMGGEWPEQVWIQARADVDSNAMTKDEDDLNSIVIGPIASGSESINLTLSDSP